MSLTLVLVKKRRRQSSTSYNKRIKYTTTHNLHKGVGYQPPTIAHAIVSRQRYPTGEFCGAVFWLKINQRLHRHFPDNETFVLEMEREVYNEGLAHQVFSFSFTLCHGVYWMTSFVLFVWRTFPFSLFSHRVFILFIFLFISVGYGSWLWFLLGAFVCLHLLIRIFPWSLEYCITKTDGK